MPINATPTPTRPFANSSQLRDDRFFMAKERISIAAAIFIMAVDAVLIDLRLSPNLLNCLRNIPNSKNNMPIAPKALESESISIHDNTTNAVARIPIAMAILRTTLAFIPFWNSFIADLTLPNTSRILAVPSCILESPDERLFTNLFKPNKIPENNPLLNNSTRPLISPFLKAVPSPSPITLRTFIVLSPTFLTNSQILFIIFRNVSMPGAFILDWI